MGPSCRRTNQPAATAVQGLVTAGQEQQSHFAQQRAAAACSRISRVCSFACFADAFVYEAVRSLSDLKSTAPSVDNDVILRNKPTLPCSARTAARPAGPGRAIIAPLAQAKAFAGLECP